MSSQQKIPKKHFAGLLCAVLAICVMACSGDRGGVEQIVPSKAKPVGKRVYGPIEPVVLELPRDVIKTLGGADVEGNPLGKTYVYFKSFNLVVYRDLFDPKDYIDSISGAFKLLASNDAFVKAADVWAVQMQRKGTSDFVTMAITPAQAKNFAKSGDLKKFLEEADYLMISDQIVPPEKRLAYYKGDAMQPGPEKFTPSP